MVEVVNAVYETVSELPIVGVPYELEMPRSRLKAAVLATLQDLRGFGLSVPEEFESKMLAVADDVSYVCRNWRSRRVPPVGCVVGTALMREGRVMALTEPEAVFGGNLIRYLPQDERMGLETIIRIIDDETWWLVV